jgi:KAP family P-loop domain
MATKSSGRARTNSSEANPDVDLRSLTDPLPQTLDEVREEMNYWTARRDREGPRSDNFDGILKRITHLLGIRTGLLRYQPGSDPTPQEFEARSSSSSAAEVSPSSAPNAPVPADSWGSTTSSVVNPDSPFAPSDSPAPAAPWADHSVASSFAPPPSTAPNQAPVDLLLDFASSASASPPSATPPANLAQAPPAPAKYVFSPRALVILNKANSLAIETGRQVISTSCLLFAFSETAGDNPDTSSMVRGLLGRGVNYREVYSGFTKSRKPRTAGEPIEGLPGQFSPNARAIIEYAAEIARRTEKAHAEINPRHLLAALIAAPTGPGQPGARQFLRRQNISLDDLSEEFLTFLGAYVTPENKQAWLDILRVRGKSDLPPSAADSAPFMQKEHAQAAPDHVAPEAPTAPPELFISGTPGYTSEFCGIGGNSSVADNLGVDDLAHTLAELIVLRETRLPLAVGLFGNWGSGKSHFMNLMDRHMKSLAPQDSTVSTPGGDKWCRHIVPIYFNAWHYSDSNLWASLVTEIFDKLFDRLRPRKNEFALLQAQLKEAGGVTTLARQEVSAARAEVESATRTLASARTQRATAKEELRSFASGMQAFLPDISSEETRQQVFDVLGVAAAEATLNDVLKKRSELSSIGGRVRELWRRATAPEGRTQRFAWLAGGLAAVILMRYGLPALLHSPSLESALQKLTTWMKAVILFLTASLAWLTPAIRKVQHGLKQLEAWEKKVEDAQANNPGLLALESTLSAAEASAATARAALDGAVAREQQLTVALNQLRPERQLSNFIEGRAKSADYRDQLGLVSLARRDFQALSDIFTDAKALSARKKQSPQDAEGLDKLSDSIDRVVLFIDDLDRCQPEKVVDVLQAVHLLLAYPLFAVVVGVDQRCLKQSLRIRFQGLLTPMEKHKAGESSFSADRDEPAATPLDYLEKIFHIPFHLPPMTPDGFEDLVKDLTKPPESKPRAPEPINPNEYRDPSPHLDPVAASAAAETAATMPVAGVTVETDADAPKPSAPETPPVAPLSVSTIGSVPLYEWERKALQQYSGLIQTPRGAKRFLNTYRLVRAGLTSKEWDSFRENSGGPQEFRMAMLFLAVAAGQPSVARDWFLRLRNLDPDKLPSGPQPGDNPRAWTAFYTQYHQIRTGPADQFIAAQQEKWLTRVERFTF